MYKTKKQIIEDLKLIDVVVELLDARIPVSSHNPDINDIIKNKKKIVVLNKCDLSEDIENKKWLQEYTTNNVQAVLVDSNTGKGINEAIFKIQYVMKDDLETHAKKGKVGRSIRVMILGIPNVGKSSFINRLTKKTSAKVGNKPGVTKQKQWVRLGNSIELLDTPGVLWPKLDNENIALNLAFTGSIKDDILEKAELAYELLKRFINDYSTNIMERYKIENIENYDIVSLMEAIGKKRGAISSGGKIDLEKVSNIILEDFRSGKLGKITLEKVGGVK